MEVVSLGRKGYEAYAKATGGKTFDGRDMPTWEQLPERIVNAWNAAAVAIAEEVLITTGEPMPATLPAPEGYPA